MCSTTGGESLVDFEFDCMNQVWEVCPIIDEERGHVVANKILVSALAVDFGRKPMSISTAFAPNSRKKC